MTMDASDSNRRVAERQEALIVVALDDKGLFGVTRDVSRTGLQIATRSRFSEGDQLELTIHAPTGSVSTTGTVVRVEEAPPAEEWRYRIAVHIDKPLPEEAIREGARAATRLLPKK
jgi:hypothetical protein